MSFKPTLVLVPGAWHGKSTWDKLAPLIEAQGYKCVRVTLPSASPNPSATFKGDIDSVRDAVVAETTQGCDVVVAVHSYGGVVGSSAIKGLTRHQQDGSSLANSSSGHVIGMIMLASGGAITGLSFLDGFGGTPPPSWEANKETGFATILVDPRELFYHDLPVEEGNYWVSKLEKQSLKALAEGGEHAYAGWKEVPVWYVATTEDHALPVELQKMFVQAAKGDGVDVTLREVKSSHSPMLSKPEETAGFVLEAMAYFSK